MKAGTLVVANTDGSGTGPGPVKVTSGRLGVTASSLARQRLAPVAGPARSLPRRLERGVQATLTIQSALTFNADATYAYTFRAEPEQRQDGRKPEVIADGVTINSGAMIELIRHTEA